jgi:gamma-D-glutamyl-L-lysine dipeptidyl-peptidase
MSEVAIVRAAIAPLHAEARVSSPQTSQRLSGHAVAVLAVEGDWLRVRGEDDYEGWMHRGYVEIAPRGPPSPEERRLSLGCVVRGADGTTRALPLGAWLRPTDSVVTGYALDPAARERALPRDAAAVATTAVERFAGTAYQWGGVSPWGADCSGLVQTAFWLHGVVLPRDAWQQAEVGTDAGSVRAQWAAGDLLFFTDRADGRVTHVGISLGDERMVHLGLGRGGYAVERLDGRDDPYVTALMARFVAARRVI